MASLRRSRWTFRHATLLGVPWLGDIIVFSRPSAGSDSVQWTASRSRRSERMWTRATVFIALGYLLSARLARPGHCRAAGRPQSGFWSAAAVGPRLPAVVDHLARLFDRAVDRRSRAPARVNRPPAAPLDGPWGRSVRRVGEWLRRRLRADLMRPVPVIALPLLLFGCLADHAERRVPAASERQRDSTIGASRLPGADGVRRALRASDSAAARRTQEDSAAREP